MKILGVTGFILICLLAISVLMDMLQGFSLTKAVYNNMSSFKMTTFAEWVVLLFFVLVLVREMYVIYKSKKEPLKGALFSDNHIAVYCITAVFVDGPFKNAVADDFGIG